MYVWTTWIGFHKSFCYWNRPVQSRHVAPVPEPRTEKPLNAVTSGCVNLTKKKKRHGGRMIIYDIMALHSQCSDLINLVHYIIERRNRGGKVSQEESFREESLIGKIHGSPVRLIRFHSRCSVLGEIWWIWMGRCLRPSKINTHTQCCVMVLGNKEIF